MSNKTLVINVQTRVAHLDCHPLRVQVVVLLFNMRYAWCSSIKYALESVMF